MAAHIMIENGVVMAQAREFAAALGKLKAKQDQGLGAVLTAEEVDALIWAIRQLRGASRP